MISFILVDTSVVTGLSIVVMDAVVVEGVVTVLAVDEVVVAVAVVVVVVAAAVVVLVVLVAVTSLVLVVIVGISIVVSSAMTAKLDKWLDKHLTIVELTKISVEIPSLDQLENVPVL